MKKITIIISFLLLGTQLIAQNPKVGKMISGKTVFKNAHIFVGNGTEITQGSLVIENGKIAEVSNLDLSTKYAGSFVVDLKGKSIYPGIISPNNSLGLTEIASIRPTSDFQEIGEYNPNVRTLIAFNTDSEVIPTVRSNGVLITQATPEGGIISGRSSIMNLDGWNWEDAVLKADDGVWLNWPSKLTNSFNPATFTREVKKNENYQSKIKEIETFFLQSGTVSPENQYENLKLSAMAGILSGTSRLYLSVSSEKEAIDAISFAKAQKIKYPVLVGAIYSDIVIDLLKQNNIPVLIPSTHRLPESSDSDVWSAYKLPAKLISKGLLVGMYYNDSYWRTRNLPFVAGNAAGHGISKAQALSMITLNNAKILGIDDQVGTIEAGKLATFVVSSGDILDMRTSRIERAYISGKEVLLDDKQKRLAEKYMEKYGLEK
ncbi:MAG: amidohydrolase family protein [Cytophagaceae bacterium]|nr:amidohydrolase family protein [Cytophagaceae bacterium]